MKMEFLNQNILITTTMVTVPSGSTSVDKLFDKDDSLLYKTSGQNADTTGVTITVAFGSTQSVDRIVLENNNLKDFTSYYNNTITNLFSLGSGNLTTSSDFTGNSATHLYIHFDTPINATSVSILASATIVTNEEKSIGQLWLASKNLALPFNPDARSYKVKIKPKEFVHNMSDGGNVLYRINNNFSTDMKLEFLSSTVEVNLKALYDNASEIVFTPFPTGTAWNGDIFEVVWIGDYDFKTFSSNYKDNGFKGTIRLRETPK